MPRLNNSFSRYNAELLNRLVEIEQADADACKHCGGEDCICCEIYQDRQRWVPPEELFDDSDNRNY